MGVRSTPKTPHTRLIEMLQLKEVKAIGIYIIEMTSNQEGSLSAVGGNQARRFHPPSCGNRH